MEPVELISVSEQYPYSVLFKNVTLPEVKFVALVVQVAEVRIVVAENETDGADFRETVQLFEGIGGFPSDTERVTSNDVPDVAEKDDLVNRTAVAVQVPEEGVESLYVGVVRTEVDITRNDDTAHGENTALGII